MTIHRMPTQRVNHERPVIVIGEALAAEIDEHAWIAADIDANVDKPAKAHARNDARAAALQLVDVDAMRCKGAL
jgi:hypothetical protein